MTSSLLSNHPDASAVVVDTEPEFEKALASPTSYGAGSNGASCYNSDGKTCLWYNNYHPGMAIHKLVAGSVAGSLNGSFF
jgi:phospholipase/lecithinase/hemolysin